ncbi:MAG: PH domain-containing protein, partial [Nitriliruptoraceae bacterium]|nr:PH domain-containing protein [Nitriliruptoraceae bacterium]
APPTTGPTSPPPGGPPQAAAATEAPARPRPTGDPVVDDALARFGIPRRLHPASVVLGIPFSALVQALLVPLFAVGVTGGAVVSLGFAIVAGVLGLAARILDHQFRLFSFDGEVLRVSYGIISRNKRTLDIARIQQVEMQRGPVQRVLGLATLRIETAGSATEVEVDLRVLTLEDAQSLRAAVRARKAQLTGRGTPTDAATTDEDDGDAHHVIAVPTRHIVIASVTGARLLVLPAVIGGLLQFAGQQIGPFIDQVTDLLIAQGDEVTRNGVPSVTDWRLVALSALAVALLAVIAAIAVGLVRDWRFRIERVDEDLHVTRGLISTRESVVPLRRVQLVEVNRNWLRRLFGFGTVRIRSAGGSTGGDGRVTVPLLRDDQVDGLLRQVLPGTDGIPALTSHPRPALRRAFVRWLRPVLYLLVLLWVAPALLPDTVWFVGSTALEVAQRAALALIPINLVLAYVEYRNLAHGLTERVVASRQGALSIQTAIAPVVKAQAVSTVATWFQRRLRLASLVVHIAGPGASVGVLDAHEDDAAALHARLTEHAASPIPLEQDLQEAPA